VVRKGSVTVYRACLRLLVARDAMAPLSSAVRMVRGQRRLNITSQVSSLRTFDGVIDFWNWKTRGDALDLVCTRWGVFRYD
jgi:hypothetical protein